MKILDGKVVANKLTLELKNEFAAVTKELGRKPILAIVFVGNNPASEKYIAKKIAKADELGVETQVYSFPEKIRYKQLLKKMDEINEIADGIIVQLPLPESINTYTQPILDAVRFEKDVDGLSSRNSFNFYNKTKDFYFTPATAQAIMELLDYYNIDFDGKRVAVIGRSLLVGKPTANLLKTRNVGQVSTHNRESGIKGVENADILVVVAGVPHLINKKNIKEDAVVVDVGSTLVEEDGTKCLRGDVDYTDLENHISALAPSPGGVGPLTVVCLFRNLLRAVKNNNDL
ncbi:methylene tetrahydrofolate dehydrogenase [Mycoplasmopsis californica]|uniref:bifunctional 5,10-methylenetetrahydrofolate dehydrogenase/5,10-methenyltetrahydrofolate cyclohydrolase n=1 Tax=Mycoplasmopsis californica TaxID=2113 RepID=UPI000EB647A5|nr:bifunctional 5,10-methylenetetrahydrofolate dehydrogenase/5,10-methenyltetrahydrofolate cyclohydrolase [Mycoplasmopsis californica]BBG40948.1 methylene tetrahydrofolate dehydrogenase [Mycoplasmopsis californica]BBG41542.1 methylene tetrahydrofolate dehydrogenase [Mycoplasmopsis californica]BBG42135.1 methylene tetrahydrofolate dehydrogenase [Mycoplasmopsis californica]